MDISVLFAHWAAENQVLGLQSKGLLEIGYDADFVILDDDLNVLSTWIAGEKVWEKQ